MEQHTKLKSTAIFLTGWIVSTVAMYLVSLTWHGFILNDLSKLSYSLNIYLMLSGAIYFCLGFGFSFLNIYLDYFKSRVVAAIILGFSIGLFLYLIAFVFGVSFYTKPNLLHIIVDASWQAFEGVIGSSCTLAVAMIMEHRKRLQEAFQ